MTESEEKLYAKMATIELELINLRQGYLIVNKRYNEAIGSLQELTRHASVAAEKAAGGAQNSRLSADRAAAAARLAADSHIIDAAEAAAEAAQAAAEAAAESAASASAAASAAAHQAESVAVQASSAAAAAASIATEAAAQAVKFSNAASASARRAREQ